MSKSSSMLICRTPFRVSFFGGGTDYPAWFRDHGGATLATSIDQYAYLTCRARPALSDHKYTVIYYSAIECAQRIEDIDHPAVRGVLRTLGDEHGLELHYQADLPGRSGLGGSSAFTVGLINAWLALRGQSLSKRDLAQAAIRIEQDVIGETVGCQDQISTAYGGLNRIEFGRGDRGFEVQPIALAPARRAELERSLVLCYTGIQRHSQEIARAKIAGFKAHATELRAIHQMVDEACAILADPARSVLELGPLLDQSWRLKRSLAPGVSNPRIDDLYARARAAGALGGKLLGAGAGGFILLQSRPEDRDRLLAALGGAPVLPVRFEDGGSVILELQPREARRREATGLAPSEWN